MTVRYIPQITAIVYELLAAGNKKLTQKKKNLTIANPETNLI